MVDRLDGRGLLGQLWLRRVEPYVEGLWVIKECVRVAQRLRKRKWRVILHFPVGGAVIQERGAPSLGSPLFFASSSTSPFSHHSGVLFIDFIAKSRLRVDLVVGRFSKITRLVINSNILTYHCIHHIHCEFWIQVLDFKRWFRCRLMKLYSYKWDWRFND